MSATPVRNPPIASVTPTTLTKLSTGLKIGVLLSHSMRGVEGLTSNTLSDSWEKKSITVLYTAPRMYSFSNSTSW